MSLVSLVKIPLNTDQPLKEAITQALNLIEYSLDTSIRKIVIKPNLCYYWDATTGQTTSPYFVGNLIDLIRTQIPEADISIVESDASAMRCKYAFKMLGYTRLAEEKQVRLINLTEDQTTNRRIQCNGKTYNFMVPKTIQEAELRINIAHIKYTTDPIKLTCALKNIFGCNPVQKKSKYHPDLGNVIVALNKAMPFNLALIDNTIAAGVQPRRMGLVMASQDPVALDCAAAKIAWLNPAKIPYFRIAEQEGVGKRVYVLRGEPLESFRVLYPKPPINMKFKKQLKKTLVTVGLGKRMGLV